MTAHPAEDDHLAALSMAGAAASFGDYTPDRVTLTLSGSDVATDLVVYLHEAHHQALNDSTAWGAALHLFAALASPQRHCFRPLLDVCRLPHEAYATFAAVNIATVHHQQAEDALARFPRYARLHQALATIVAGAGGPHRQYLLATALARVAMQTPILSRIIDAPDLIVNPADIRAIDTPDGRWRSLRRGRDLADRAAARADGDVTSAFGALGLLADDGADPAAAAADELDAHWQHWEQAAYDVLAAALAESGATVLQFNGHMELTVVALARARVLSPGLTLRAARPESPAPDDRALSAATIQYVRLTLADPPRPADLRSLAPDALAAIIDERQRIDGEPSLVVSARLPQRMLDSYRWGSDDAVTLRHATAPVVAIRVIEPGAGASTIVHAPLPATDELEAVVAAWSERGPLVTVAGASCFVHTAWAATWLPTLRAAGPLVVLVDVEAERFVGSWVSAGLAVRAGTMRIQDSTGVYWATGLRVGDDTSLWLHLADETTVKLLLDQLRHTAGLDLQEDVAHLADWMPVLSSTITHLLATESFLDLQGLDADTIRRVTAIKPVQTD